MMEPMEHLDQRRKLAIILSIMAAMLFVALNQTIVGTALPRIVSELGGIDYFEWVFTIFMLASSITAILVGKISDIYGRKPFILIGLGIFTLGSFLCGTSPTIYHMIAYRFLQGFGGGMIMSTAFTSIGDLFPPRERGRWQGLMAASFGIASVFGPTMGGYIVDHWDWHWVFWIFLPFGLVAFSLIFWLFPTIKPDSHAKIDYWGAVFLAGTVTPLMLAFSLGGTTFAWSSVPIFMLVGGMGVSFALFVLTEKKAPNPILPLHLFKNSIFTISNVVKFIIGMGMFSIIMFMPFFIQGVMERSATQTGFIMMTMTLSMVLASTSVGQFITKSGKYKRWANGGLLLMAAGIYFISQLDGSSTNLRLILSLIPVGLGLGTAFPIFILTIQNAVEHEHLGVATSSAQLFRQLGGTVGVSLMGTILSSQMSSRIQSSALPIAEENLTEEAKAEFAQLQNPKNLMDPEKIQAIRSDMPERFAASFETMLSFLRDTLQQALTGVFLTALVIILTGFVLSLFLKEIPLRTTNQKKDEQTEESPQDANL